MSLEANHNTDFTVGAYAGQMSADVDRESLLAWAADIATHVRASDVDVISDGRNRNVRVNATIGGARRDLLVKSFGRESPLSDRLRRARGSKARCTWDAAAHLLKHKVPTPRPVCFVERTENGCVVESYFVSDFLTDSISFTDALVERFTGDPQCVAFMDLLQHVADSSRVMHEAGFLHNDLGNQNILLQFYLKHKKKQNKNICQSIYTKIRFSPTKHVVFSSTKKKQCSHFDKMTENDQALANSPRN